MLKPFLLIFLSFSISTLNAASQKTLEEFAPYVEKTLKKWQVPGAAIAIVSKDKVLWMQTYGVRSLKTEKPVNDPQRSPHF